MSLPNIYYECSGSHNREKETIVFLHGKLSGRGVERPALHCAPFLREIVCKSNLRVVMLEYHLLFKDILDEPLSMKLGSISGQLYESVAEIMAKHDKVTFMAYSFGCFMLAKLLKTKLNNVDKIILIAPVMPKSIIEVQSPIISELPSIIIWGTHDNYAKKVELLRLYFPKASYAPIEGGNHLYYLMPSPMDRFDENPATISREYQCKYTAEKITNYLNIKENDECMKYRILEKTLDKCVDLTTIYYSKLSEAQLLYKRYDQQNFNGVLN